METDKEMKNRHEKELEELKQEHFTELDKRGIVLEKNDILGAITIEDNGILPTIKTRFSTPNADGREKRFFKNLKDGDRIVINKIGGN